MLDIFFNLRILISFFVEIKQQELSDLPAPAGSCFAIFPVFAEYMQLF